jgi:hypothetical protein
MAITARTATGRRRQARCLLSRLKTRLIDVADANVNRYGQARTR